MPDKSEIEKAAEARAGKDDTSPGARFVRRCPCCGDLVQTHDGTGDTPCMVCRKLPADEQKRRREAVNPTPKPETPAGDPTMPQEAPGEIAGPQGQAG